MSIAQSTQIRLDRFQVDGPRDASEFRIVNTVHFGFYYLLTPTSKEAPAHAGVTRSLPGSGQGREIYYEVDNTVCKQYTVACRQLRYWYMILCAMCFLLVRDRYFGHPERDTFANTYLINVPVNRTCAHTARTYVWGNGTQMRARWMAAWHGIAGSWQGE